MNCSGGDAVSGWTAVNLAMAPFLVVAGAALIWLALAAGRSAPADARRRKERKCTASRNDIGWRKVT